MVSQSPSREPGAPIISEATDEDYYENVVIEEPNAGRLISYQVQGANKKMDPHPDKFTPFLTIFPRSF